MLIDGIASSKNFASRPRGLRGVFETCLSRCVLNRSLHESVLILTGYQMDNDQEIEFISEQRWINHILISLILIEIIALLSSLIWL